MLADADRAKELFLRATAYADRTERASFVMRECGSNAELRRWVDNLLAAFDQAADAPPNPTPPSGSPVGPEHIPVDLNVTTDLNSGDVEPAKTPSPKESDPTATSDLASGPVSPASPPARTTELNPDDAGKVGSSFDDAPTSTFSPGAKPKVRSDKADSEIGKIIGDKYRLLSLIGEGGMGSVYLARQSEPVKRDVALKLIKVGLDSRGVLARFEAERQALALMEHPNIAHVYDGGTTPSGSPFFVMELVRGVPITTYCDEKRLKPDERLDLFVQVCRAVQHAHQKGIIHRDLKPANILVTEVDGKPTPKVIDFGVAKATEQRLTDLSFSDVGAVVGTPVYMSPEQADPSTMDIDTRTDVYALGVILYQLLTGTPPIQVSDFKRGAVIEMLRIVRDVEPPRPSTRARSDPALPNIAANRALEPSRLLSFLRGDIDWIIMKAIEKNRNRRYDSANGLASDILHYLSNEPVVARPPTRSYRLRKFVRRNRTAATVAAVIAASVLFGIVGIVVQWREAVFQRSQAINAKNEAEANFQVAMEQRMVALRALGQVLDIARKELPKLAAVQDVQKKILNITKESLNNIAENPLVQVSLNDTTLAAAHVSTGHLHRQLGDLQQALDDFRRAEAIYEKILQTAPEGEWRETVKQNLAIVKIALAQTILRIGSPGSTVEAKILIDKARDLFGEVGPSAPADFRRNLADLFLFVGTVISSTNPAEGRRLYGESLRLMEELIRDHPSSDNLIRLVSSYLLVGGGDFRLRDPGSTEKLYRLAIRIADGEAAKTNEIIWKNKSATAHERLGDFLIRIGKAKEAITEYQTAVDIFRSISMNDPKNIDAAADYSRVLYSLALAENRSGNKASSMAHFKTSLEIREARVKEKQEPAAYTDLMVALAQNQRTKEATETADMVLKKYESRPSLLVDVACCFAICSGVMPNDPTGKEAAEKYALRAMESLRKAIDSGYREVVNLETEPELDSLRSREDFKTLLREQANKVK
jgi:serine/threonine protein kinase/tetratricopeptide (TPR) repeat protein